ncbi:ubiquinone/menaquinone biosynthesis C-methylase UbiE [Agrobacterium vitis]|nr:ubiquinone/menaquinone biosynthesis C-methylase UbiE [Agrobacterium vitis]MBE1438382.1 ubiquinone/menaquinone biosynthesis C-methylase UbiE [Agrobacterium vitis]
MNMMMPRTPEPERMTEEEEFFYAKADYSAPHEALAKEIYATVGSGAKWAIDIGCGPGDVLLRLRRLATDWILVGADISARMLSLASEDEAKRLTANETPINWLMINGRRIALPEATFDVVISNSVLHHVADPVHFWSEIGRLSKPGTEVFVRDLRRPASEAEARAIIERNIPNEYEVVKTHYFSSLLSSYTCSEVESQLRKAGISGLSVMEIEDRYLSVQGTVDK